MPTESRTEQLLNAYINGDDISNFVPLSRNEQILKDMILGNEQTSSPQSRIESLYKRLDEKIKEGSGILQYIIDNRGGDGVPSCQYLFYKYLGSNLNNLFEKIDYSKVKDMSSMFSGCTNLTSDPNINTANANNTREMYAYCTNITEFNEFDMRNVEYAGGMFQGCKSLKKIILKNTNKIISFGSMFYGCAELEDAPELSFEGQNVDYDSNGEYVFYSRSVGSLFYGCKKLVNVPFLNINHAYYASSMFRECSSLKEVRIGLASDLNTSDSMFKDCNSLEKIIFESYGGLGNTGWAFSNCYSLKKIIVKDYITSWKEYDFVNNNNLNNCYHFYGTQNDLYNPDGLNDGVIYYPDYVVESIKTLADSNFINKIKPISVLYNNVGDIIISNTLNANTTYKTCIYLNGFTSNPEVTINSSNNDVFSINNISVNTDKIEFDIKTLNAGHSRLTISVSGEHSRTQYLDINVIKYKVENLSENYPFVLDKFGFYRSTMSDQNINATGTSTCKITFEIPENCNKKVILDLITLNRGGISYGKISNMDSTQINDDLIFNDYSDTSTKIKNIDYGIISPGEHYIYIHHCREYQLNNSLDTISFNLRIIDYVEEVDLKNISGYEDEQGNITTSELTYEEIN